MLVETNITPSNSFISSTTPATDFFAGRFFVVILYIAYVEPFFCGIGVVGNLMVLVAMARVRHEFSRNVRLYYSILAVADFVMVVIFFIGDFLERGIAYLATGGQSFPILTVDGTNWLCKLCEAMWIASDTVSGFTLVCLGFERFIAVTWPLRAKTILTLRFSAIFETSVNLLAVLSVIPLLIVDYKLVDGIGCWYDFSLPFTDLYIILENIIPLEYTLFSFVFNVYLTARIVLATLKRRHMMSGSGGGGGPTGVSSRELSNITMLLTIEVIRLVIYLPNSVLYFAYIWIKGDVIENLQGLFNELSLIPHAINIFVYFSRSRAFREAIFGTRCFKGVPTRSSSSKLSSNDH